MTYQVLLLGGTSNQLTLPVLQKIPALTNAGAIVVGLPPDRSPSLSDDPVQWESIVRVLWRTSALVNKLGSGKVYRTTNLSQVLGAESMRPTSPI